jgi:hypothetical protein
MKPIVCRLCGTPRSWHPQAMWDRHQEEYRESKSTRKAENAKNNKTKTTVRDAEL